VSFHLIFFNKKKTRNFFQDRPYCRNFRCAAFLWMTGIRSTIPSLVKLLFNKCPHTVFTCLVTQYLYLEQRVDSSSITYRVLRRNMIAERGMNAMIRLWPEINQQQKEYVRKLAPKVAASIAPQI